MANGEDSHLVASHEKSVDRDISGLAVRNDELAQVELDSAADQRVRRKNVDCGTDGDGPQRRRPGLFAQELECPLDVGKRAG